MKKEFEVGDEVVISDNANLGAFEHLSRPIIGVIIDTKSNSYKYPYKVEVPEIPNKYEVFGLNELTLFKEDPLEKRVRVLEEKLDSLTRMEDRKQEDTQTEEPVFELVTGGVYQYRGKDVKDVVVVIESHSGSYFLGGLGGELNVLYSDNLRRKSEMARYLSGRGYKLVGKVEVKYDE